MSGEDSNKALEVPTSSLAALSIDSISAQPSDSTHTDISIDDLRAFEAKENIRKYLEALKHNNVSMINLCSSNVSRATASSSVAPGTDGRTTQKRVLRATVNIVDIQAMAEKANLTKYLDCFNDDPSKHSYQPLICRTSSEQGGAEQSR